jgi:site-specific recombinase XerD
MPHDLITLADAPPGALVPIEDLEAARSFAEHEKAASSRRAYESDWRIFTAWCAHRGLQPLPASPQAVAAFVAAEATAGRKAATIGRRLAAIRYAHRLAGHEPPANAEAVKATMRGIRRTIGVAPAKKAAATSEIMRALLKHVRGDTLRGIRDRALLLVGLGCALRRSELVALNVEDLTETKHGKLVRIARSKTDQEGKGVEIALLRGVRLCPCDALDAWLAASEIASGPIFRSIDARGRLLDVPLTGHSVALRVKRYARLAGLDAATLSAHSLRAGFATTAAEHRADLLRIADVTRHKSLEVLRGYIRRVDVWRDHAGSGWL